MGGKEPPGEEQAHMLEVSLAPPTVPLQFVQEGGRSLHVAPPEVIGEPYAVPRPAHQGGFHEIVAQNVPSEGSPARQPGKLAVLHEGFDPDNGVVSPVLGVAELPEVKAGGEHGAVEKKQVETLRKVKAAVKIPVAVKLTSYYTNALAFIAELDKAGADAVVVFNRLLQPDIDIYTEQHIMPTNLSSSEDNRLPLRFTGMLHGNIKASVCTSTGIYSANEVIKMLLAGADAVQVVSTLYRNGEDVVKSITEEVEKWMDNRGYNNIDSFRGKLSKKKSENKFAYTRAQYIDFMMNAGDIIKKYPSLS